MKNSFLRTLILALTLALVLCLSASFMACGNRGGKDSGDVVGGESTEQSSCEEQPSQEEKPTSNEYFDFILLDDNTYQIGVKDVNNMPSNVVIPSTYEGKPITSIGRYAFYDCSSLISIVIPDSVTSIGSYAFYNTPYYNNQDNWENGVLYIKNHLIAAKTDIAGIYKIKDGTLCIADSTFSYCSSLISIVIPDSVTSIGAYAFEDCTSLTSIEIPDNVTEIYNDAFYYCSSLTSVVIGNSVTSIGDSAFSNCYRLVEVINNSPHITVEKGSDSNGYVGYYALSVSNCDSSYVSKLFNDNGFIVCNDGNKKILVNYTGEQSDIFIPSYITKINSYALYNCRSLTSVEIPIGATSIGDYAFEGCSSLTSIEIPDSVTEIGNGAFWCCYRLVEIINKSSHITIAKGDWSISYYALSVVNCDDSYVSKLSSDNGFIIYTEGNQKILVSYNGEQTNLVIPSYVTKINDYAFYDCRSLTSIKIPDSVTEIGVAAFDGCSLLTSIKIPNNVTEIGYFAFQYCTSLTSVEIGNSVTSIGENLFFDCRSLTSIKITDNITSIGYSAFWGCESLTSIKIPDSVTEIGERAFYGCISLTSVEIGNSVTSIGEGVFSDCSSLTSVEIPDSVTSIGDSAFWGCESLTSIKIPDSVTEIGEHAFSFCSSIQDVYITDLIAWCKISGLKELMEYGPNNKNLYLNNELVTNLVIPNSVIEIGSYAFYCCSSLTSIKIPDSVTSIGAEAFAYCSSLTSIVIPDSVTSIGDCAFFNSAYYNNQDNWEDGVLYIGNYLIEARYYISGTYKIKDGTLCIADYASYRCSSLTSIEIPDSVTSIGWSAFNDCSSLTSVVIPDSVTAIGYMAFCDCDLLTSVYYKGTQSKWEEIEFGGYNEDLINATRYYYSENEPTEEGNFWHYNANGEIEVWDNSLATATPNEYFEFVLSEDAYGEEYIKEMYELFGVSLKNTYIVSVKDNNNLPSEVVIPSTYNGKTVTTVGDFRNCITLTSLVLPNTVMIINPYSFHCCLALTSVNLPSSLIVIGNGVFAGCRSLTSIKIPDFVIEITMMFRGSSITDIIVSENNQNISSFNGNLYNKDQTELVAYAPGKKESSFIIPNTVTKIGYGAFVECNSLTSIEIPDSITSIGEGAFYKCDSLTSVVIGNGVTEIGESAFNVCSSLENVYYKGTQIEWTQITIGLNNDNLTNATHYYYSESEPSEEGNYWHYGANGEIEVW